MYACEWCDILMTIGNKSGKGVKAPLLNNGYLFTRAVRIPDCAGVSYSYTHVAYNELNNAQSGLA